MRILMLGGTNFIGPAVVTELHASGHDVAVFHRGETERIDDPAVTHIHGYRARIDDHAAEMRRFALSAVIDMGCMFERDAQAAVGVLRSIVGSAVVVSSVDVYRAYGRMHGSEPGPVEPMPVDEDSPLRERPYPYRGERSDSSFDDYDKNPAE